MTKNEFKQGDKVKLKKYKEFTCDGELTYIDTDEIGVIVQVEADWLKVNFSDMPTLLDLRWSDVVPAEPQEVKSAFLTELQSLLRKYDAEIVFHCDYDLHTLSTSIIVGDCELRRNEVYGVCPINIMDFDKE